MVSLNRIKLHKSLGQHFLRDKNTISKIACTVKRCIEATSQLHHVSRTVEIGPGDGSLTRVLRDLIAPNQLACVEIDRRMQSIDGVRWVQQDALIFNYCQDDYVTGNLPYNISVPLLLCLCKAEVAGWCVMVQREVARKIIATAGKEYGRLAVMMQARFSVQYQFTVPPSVFVPKPRVDSAIISGTRIASSVDLANLDLLLRQVFQCRRKALRNVVSAEVMQVFEQLGVGGSVRADAIPTAVLYAASCMLHQK